jgi:hypothetical protein
VRGPGDGTWGSSSPVRIRITSLVTSADAPTACIAALAAIADRCLSTLNDPCSNSPAGSTGFRCGSFPRDLTRGRWQFKL